MISEFDKAEAQVNRAAKAVEAKFTVLKASQFPAGYVDGYKAGVSDMELMAVWLMRCAKREAEG